MILCLIGFIKEPPRNTEGVIVTIVLAIPDAAEVYNSVVRKYNLVTRGNINSPSLDL